MALACFLFGLGAVGLGLLRNFRVYIGVMGFAGITMPFYNMPSMVMLQTSVDSAFMGRVLAVFGMVGSVTMPAGMLVFGPLAGTVSIDILLVISGIIITLLTIPIIASKTLREAGKPAP